MHLLALIACTASSPEAPEAPEAPATGPAEVTTQDLDQGQQHPPLPADNPVWSRDVGGFMPEYRWYGEHSWADVRMRVAGHLSAAGRDRARLSATQGDLPQAAAHYRALADMLTGIPAQSGGISEQINALLRAAAIRDAETLAALAEGSPPPVPDTDLAAIRAKVLALAIRHRAGDDVSETATQLQHALAPHLTPRTDLDLDAFTDFTARHALRVRLFAAYLDSLDPLGIEERWGYWEASEVVRQATVLGVTLEKLGGAPFPTGDLLGAVPDLSGADPIRWPSLLAEALRSPDQAPDFTLHDIAVLPTGDTLIDTAGHPGPRAIGTLQKLGIDDPAHQPWLLETGNALDAALSSDPAAVVTEIRGGVADLEQYTHGSRFYNIKQLRNAGVRELARAGAYPEALAVLSDNWPLHHQDWACPNRAGILRAVEGRLRAEAGDPRADAVLAQAIAEGRGFLAEVEAAAARGPQGPQGPPNGGGHRGPGGAPARSGPPR